MHLPLRYSGRAALAQHARHARPPSVPRGSRVRMWRHSEREWDRWGEPRQFRHDSRRLHGERNGHVRVNHRIRRVYHRRAIANTRWMEPGRVHNTPKRISSIPHRCSMSRCATLQQPNIGTISVVVAISRAVLPTLAHPSISRFTARVVEECRTGCVSARAMNRGAPC